MIPHWPATFLLLTQPTSTTTRKVVVVAMKIYRFVEMLIGGR